MVLYLDTSALLKLYVAEEHSRWVRDLVDVHRRSGGAVSISAVGYVEARAAFARMLKRRKAISAESYERVVRKLMDDAGARYLVRPTDPALLERAATVAHEHALRGYDAVHLATALHLRHELRNRARQLTLEDDRREREREARVLVLTFDDELFEAAKAENVAHAHPVWGGDAGFETETG